MLAFFIGPMREDGTVDHSLGHDYLGKKIGQAGQEFALNHWRWVDMQAYVSLQGERAVGSVDDSLRPIAHDDSRRRSPTRLLPLLPRHG